MWYFMKGFSIPDKQMQLVSSYFEADRLGRSLLDL